MGNTFLSSVRVSQINLMNNLVTEIDIHNPIAKVEAKRRIAFESMG
jgi:hypothetical protein